MSPSTFINLSATALSALILLIAGGKAAIAQVFTIDTNQSSVTISGTVMGAAITPQGPGSLAGVIGGTLQTALAANKIQFTGQSKILAETNGSWQPKSDGTAGSEPADYGGSVNLGLATGLAALRNVQLDVISTNVDVNAGKFDSSSLTFFFPSNAVSALAYNITGLNKHGVAALTGYATNKVTSLASLTTVGSQQVLTIPVDATFMLKLVTPNDTIIRLQGQIVATQGSQPAPLKVQSFAVTNQAILLQWQAAPGQQFIVQSTTNLTGGWQTNATIVTPASGANTYTGAAVGPVKFFRLAK